MISGLGRRRIQKQIESLNTNDRVALFIPSYYDCPDCGYDEKSGAGKNITCLTCNGTGRVERWATAYIFGRVAWTDVGRPRFSGVVGTEELGDATFETRLANKELLEDVRDSEKPYIEIDGRRLRVMSVDANRIEGKTTTVARCELIRND